MSSIVGHSNSFWDLAVSFSRQQGCCGMGVVDTLRVNRKPDRPTDRGKKAIFKALDCAIGLHALRSSQGVVTLTTLTPNGVNDPTRAYWNSTHPHVDGCSLWDLATLCGWTRVMDSRSLSTGNQIVLFYKDYAMEL